MWRNRRESNLFPFIQVPILGFCSIDGSHYVLVGSFRDGFWPYLPPKPHSLLHLRMTASHAGFLELGALCYYSLWIPWPSAMSLRWKVLRDATSCHTTLPQIHCMQRCILWDEKFGTSEVSYRDNYSSPCLSWSVQNIWHRNEVRQEIPDNRLNTKLHSGSNDRM